MEQPAEDPSCAGCNRQIISEYRYVGWLGRAGLWNLPRITKRAGVVRECYLDRESDI
ncbi:hypothetical protein [Bartonella choladocola]|uniref:hypothetical protein n=1 Tax=Bartonella choladocola TaxID=2750995 RepID=UPI0016628958|nr:hypothetical protein [Bartonella choladocola]